MKLSKKLSGISIIALSALTLAACGGGDSSKDSSSEKASSSQVEKKESTKEAAPKKQVAGGALKDGTYNLEEKDYYNGYRVKMSMTVKDGKVTATTYDNVDKDGKSKADDKKYEESMQKVNKIGPKEYIQQLNDSFTKNGADVEAIDVVSGATSSSLSFKNYANQLVQAAQAGKTDTIEIANGQKMKDGTYTLEEKNDFNGYHVVFSIVVKDGKIAESKYDNVNADGKSKVDDKKYEDSMMKVNKVGPKEYIKQLNESLVKGQTAEKVDVVSGATSSSNGFKLYAEQLINAAQAGKTDKIVVDNIVYGE